MTKINIKPVHIKCELSDLEFLVLQQLQLLDGKRQNAYIAFPDTYARAGRIYHLRKSQTMDILYALQKKGFINLVRGHGIILNSERAATSTSRFPELYCSSHSSAPEKSKRCFNG